MRKIRAAILGYGRSGGSMHAGPIEKLDAFEMAAVCDIDPERRAQASQRFGCAVYDNYREMLGRQQLDLVCVITRNDQHCDMTCDCLNAGVNVLVTKPWAANANEAGRMLSAARASGRLLLPWLPARWGSELRKLQSLCRENAVGKVFAIRRAVTSFGTRNDWQTESRFAGGYLLNWGPHIVEPPVLLAGGKVKSVFGRMKQIINPGDVEDLFLAVITMQNGVIVQAEYTISLAPVPSWVVQGDKGTITINGSQVDVLSNSPVKPEDPTRFESMTAGNNAAATATLEGQAYGDEYEIYSEIAASLRGERKFAVQPQDAFELTRILDAVRISAAEDRVVRL